MNYPQNGRPFEPAKSKIDTAVDAAKSLLNKINNFALDGGGNIAMISALAMIPILFSVGAAVDYSRFAKLKAEAIHATDSAIMAAAIKARDEAEWKDAKTPKQRDEVIAVMKEEFNRFFEANTSSEVSSNVVDIKLDFDSEKQVFTADLDFKFNTVFYTRLAPKGIKVPIVSEVKVDLENETPPLSIILVLDDSGSMQARTKTGRGPCKIYYYWGRAYKSCKYQYGSTTNIQALKAAVTNMMINFKKKATDDGQKENESIRAGAISFAHYMRAESRPSWELDTVKNFLNRLITSGGTRPSSSISKAISRLTSQLEENEHQGKSGTSPNKAIVFMTDGILHDPDATLYYCRLAAQKGIDVYAVAFGLADEIDTRMRNCASSKDKFYIASGAQQLIAAFDKIGTEAANQMAFTR